MADAEAKVDISRVLNNTFGVVISRNPVVFLGLSAADRGHSQCDFAVHSRAIPAAQSAGAFASPAIVISGVLSAFFVLIFFSVILQATLIVATVKDLSGEPDQSGRLHQQGYCQSFFRFDRHWVS